MPPKGVKGDLEAPAASNIKLNRNTPIMKIIVPMAGLGKRMRPHTLTIPKPLLRIAGKPIVQRLLEDIVKVSGTAVDEIAYIIGDFGQEVEDNLKAIANELGASPSIHYQHEPLGTAHAILCASDALEGEVIVAFADTLFSANFTLDRDADGIIWVHRVEDPSAFGVVCTNERGIINRFVEKPAEFVSDQAIIGIYYFRDGANLKEELQYLIDHDIAKGGEYQLTDALQNMMLKGMQFSTGAVDEWLDCGNKNATVHTNQRILELNRHENLIAESVSIEDALIIPPCFIGEGVVIRKSIIGPHVSVGEGCTVIDSIITNSIIQNQTKVENINIDNSMIGSYVDYKGKYNEVSIGDFTAMQ
jgi:glucose-1-phosphate thymidylyltransferase